MNEEKKQLKKRVNISITDEEKKIITKKARAEGRSLSNYLVNLGLNKES